MAEVLAAVRRIDVPTTALGAACLIGSYELRKQAFWYRYVTKQVGRFDESVLPLAVGIAGVITRNALLQKMLIVGLMLAINDAYLDYVAKEPWVVAKDASTLQLKNFDAGSRVHVVIDGAEVSFTTAPTTDSAGNATVTLPSPMSSGLHKLVVYTEGGKGWAGYVVV